MQERSPLSLSPSAGLSGERALLSMDRAFFGEGKCAAAAVLSTELGGGCGDRFGDYFCVDCANLPCVTNTDTKFAKPYTKVSKSRVVT